MEALSAIKKTPDYFAIRGFTFTAMKYPRLLFLRFLALLILFSGCITLAPSRGKGVYESHTTTEVENTDFIQFINEEKLNRIKERDDTTLVLLFATWCAGCYAEFINDGYLAMEEENPGVHFVYVSSNYHLASLRKLQPHTHQSEIYVLEPDVFGESEKERIAKFRATFCPGCKPLSGLPQYFVVKNGALLHHGGGKVEENHLRNDSL